jgi:hypothetical protein
MRPFIIRQREGRVYAAVLALVGLVGLVLTVPTVATAAPAATLTITGTSTATNAAGTSVVIGDVFTWSLTLDLTSESTSSTPSFGNGFEDAVLDFSVVASTDNVGTWDPAGVVWVITPVFNFDANANGNGLTVQIKPVAAPDIDGSPFFDLTVALQWDAADLDAVWEAGTVTLASWLGTTEPPLALANVAFRLRNEAHLDTFGAVEFATALVPDVVFLCPEVSFEFLDLTAFELTGRDFAVPGSGVFIRPNLQIYGYTAADAPTSLDGCERFDDPTVLDEFGQQDSLLYFTGGSVSLSIESDGLALKWTAITDFIITDYIMNEGVEDPDLVWLIQDDDEEFLTSFAAFLRGESMSTDDGFVAGGAQSAPFIMALTDGIALGEYTVTVSFTLSAAGIVPVLGAPTETLEASSTFLVGLPEASAAGPGATVSCTPPAAGGVVTCDLQSDPEVEFVWEASTNPVFASGVVTTDAAGVGRFVFTVPASALGQPVLVEIVGWTAATSIGVAAGPVPTSVPSGGGPRAPLGDLLVLGVAMLGAVVFVRVASRRAAGVRVG